MSGKYYGPNWKFSVPITKHFHLSILWDHLIQQELSKPWKIGNIFYIIKNLKIWFLKNCPAQFLDFNCSDLHKMSILWGYKSPSSTFFSYLPSAVRTVWLCAVCDNVMSWSRGHCEWRDEYKDLLLDALHQQSAEQLLDNWDGGLKLAAASATLQSNNTEKASWDTV